MKNILLIGLALFIFSCAEIQVNEVSKENTHGSIQQFSNPNFGLKEANKLIELPLHCAETEYPNKLGQTIGHDLDLKAPEELHPIFYGCFDWHSAVHGYWSMVLILKKFPEINRADEVRSLLKKNITQEKVLRELAYFEKKINKSYERTYGWAWLLKLSQELHTWNDPLGKELATNLDPLAQLIEQKYIDFLPKLVYPIRVGEHTNTAFGLSFAFDYAEALEKVDLKEAITARAKAFYLTDKNCPITWEPSGFDFLSPCLEEIDVMRRVLPSTTFHIWMSSFMPELSDANYTLDVGEVSDRTDGKLVHLDGLNFSRAWVFYGLANQYPNKYQHLNNLANQHVAYSYPNLVGDSYEGGHWLGSFAIYSLLQIK